MQVSWKVPEELASCLLFSSPYRVDDCLFDGSPLADDPKHRRCAGYVSEFNPLEPHEYMCNDSQTQVIHAMPLQSYDRKSGAYNRSSTANLRDGKCSFAPVVVLVRNMCRPAVAFSTATLVQKYGDTHVNATRGCKDDTALGDLGNILPVVLYLNVGVAVCALLMCCFTCHACPLHNAMDRIRTARRLRSESRGGAPNVYHL